MRTTQDRLTLEDGWPGLDRGEIADEDLTLEDTPGEEANEDALQTFALTTNGYERMGMFARCVDLSNSARETWRRTREVPDSLRDLRCCLFFEQRRFHHYGNGFDKMYGAMFASMRGSPYARVIDRVDLVAG